MTDNRNRLDDIVKLLKDYEIHTISECLGDMDFQDTFPEDMCESRTDWETLRDRLSTAHCTVDYLMDVIERLCEDVCGKCRKYYELADDHSWTLDKISPPCSRCNFINNGGQEV